MSNTRYLPTFDAQPCKSSEQTIPEAPPIIGRTVSHYTIIDKLGAGGMGEAFRAEDTRLKRTVALKFLPPDLTRDPEAKERFIHEAQAASSLQHPNFCVVHDIDVTADGQWWREERGGRSQ